MGLKSTFHPHVDVESKMIYLAPPAFLMAKNDRTLLFEFLKKVKLPYGYESNISKALGNKKISGLKSHDFHMLMQ